MEIRFTADGSTTLYDSRLDENYHSLHGAYTESRYVYIECGLQHRFQQAPKGLLRVFEVGFGTGLNAALTLQTNIPVQYTSVEKYPLPIEIIRQLRFGSDNEMACHAETLLRLHESPWNENVKINDNFSLRKLDNDFLETSFEDKFDVIFMDAFAPEKQPSMWTDEILKKLVDMLSPEGIMTTYCAKGLIRRTFESMGLTAERLPGPPGGKREILRLTKPKNPII